ncbi:hypothetical protein B9Z19DRAFT_1123038 [Tuber borchii]|uniref:Uncharacterized protein n=1 Tax=Tuber borchii TaxID=42251 RepID=A0A2T6ZZ62_TUBBO|nr:hypothetical protein B9Z19DRAFT_1123038 [Tuber borchii]
MVNSVKPIPSLVTVCDNIPIRAFSMALQSLLKGESICQVFLDVWKALTLKPDSWGVRHAIMKPFHNGVLCHPICPPPKGHPHTSIFHGATESSEGGSLCQVFLVLGVFRALTLKPDFGGVKHAIIKPFYNSVLCHPICPPPKGHPHTSIFHGATESSEGGIPGALGMRSWSPFMMAFYTILAVHCQKGVSIEGVSIALSP